MIAKWQQDKQYIYVRFGSKDFFEILEVWHFSTNICLA